MTDNAATRPLGALLTGRELLRVQREHYARYGRDTSSTRAEYTAQLRAIATELYPAKVEG